MEIFRKPCFVGLFGGDYAGLTPRKEIASLIDEFLVIGICLINEIRHGVDSHGFFNNHFGSNFYGNLGASPSYGTPGTCVDGDFGAGLANGDSYVARAPRRQSYPNEDEDSANGGFDGYGPWRTSRILGLRSTWS